MTYYVYILKSKVAKKTYVGHTNNLERRVFEHDNGKSLFSKRYRPWAVFYVEDIADESEAIRREKYFKSAAGRRWMKKNLFSN